MPLKSDIDRHDTDILILGTGGAGLFGALHAQLVSLQNFKFKATRGQDLSRTSESFRKLSFGLKFESFRTLSLDGKKIWGKKD